MTDIKAHRTVGSPFSNEEEIVICRYDFDEDGGAVGALSILECEDACIVEFVEAVVKTAGASGGSMTLDLGINGGDTDQFLDDVAVAALTANSLHQPVLVEGTPNAFAPKAYVAAGGNIDMEIKTAALTAGVIDFKFKVRKP